MPFWTLGSLLSQFLFSIIGSTIAVPHGMFIPALKIGSGFGRLLGEFVAWSFPQGVRYGNCMSPIMPAAYAIVGAAAFSGSVTHSISVAVVVFEITGQICFAVPVLVAVLVANAVASLLQPSMYESVILIKKLPYLPDLLYINSGFYDKFVEDFMLRDVKYMWQGISYQKLKQLLKSNQKLRSLPLVDSPESMVLLGSVQRQELIKIIEQQIGREKRMATAYRWHEEEIKEQAADRRSSRFEIVPTQDIQSLRQLHSDATVSNGSPDQQRSILKKSSRSHDSLSSTHSQTESRFRSAFQSFFRRSIDPELNLETDAQDDLHIRSSTTKRVHLVWLRQIFWYSNSI